MLKFLFWEACQFILTQPSWHWLCYCSSYKIYGKVIQRSQDELERVVQGVVHNINRDTICPEDSYDRRPGTISSFPQVSSYNCLTDISCWPAFPVLSCELWRVLSCSSVRSVHGGGLKWGLHWAVGGAKGRDLMWRERNSRALGYKKVWLHAAIHKIGCSCKYL